MNPRLTFLILVGLLTGACSSATGPSGEAALLMSDDSSPADFSSWLVRPGSDPVPDFSIEGGPGKISIQGAIGTPYPCFDVEGYVERTTGHIRFTVDAVRRPVLCSAVVATFAYQGVLRDLQPGAYQVQLIHSLNGHSTEVLETTVLVR